MQNILITGGAGFIGSNFVHYLLGKYQDYQVIVLDKLTYAGNLENLEPVAGDPRYHFIKADICDSDTVVRIMGQFGFDAIVNFAAETHVDRSILEPDAFIQTNIVGTYTLLEAAREFEIERYHQVSTDEVYGDVPAGYASLETDPVAPRSPYASSKASGDLMTLAYHTTYGLPVTITRGANNIGPYQYPEKVVPLFATNAIDYQPLPVYGDGRQMRDYQYVGDHCSAIDLVLHSGMVGEVYNIGTGHEMENMAMIKILLKALDRPEELIRHVADRPGHDRRYSLNVTKMRQLGWKPQYSLEQSVQMTAEWYAANQEWWRKIKAGEFKDYYDRQYGERLKTSEKLQE